MLQRRCPSICALLALLALPLMAACASSGPPPTVTPAPVTPSPTLTPSPTPTVTPIPPLVLSIPWPEQVSALHPVTITVDLVPPPGVPVTVTIRTAVIDPAGMLYQDFDLVPGGDNLYTAQEPLQLPLEPPEGDWRLAVYVRSVLNVEGDPELIFRPAPIRFRDLTDVVPAGASIDVPSSFEEVAAHGDQVAGGRVWRYVGGEVGLWWAPGPAEPMLLNNARVMLETTHDPGASPDVLGVDQIEWHEELTAFLFHEEWEGPEGGPAEALVAEGPNDWLYVVRVRALGSQTIPLLLRQVWDTFSLFEE